MSISNFCLSESSSSKFLDELTADTNQKMSELGVQLTDLSSEELQKRKVASLFEIEAKRIEKIEEFLRSLPSANKKTNPSSKFTENNDENVLQSFLNNEPQIEDIKKIVLKTKKRSSMFQGQLSQKNLASFKRYSAIPEKIGESLFKMDLPTQFILNHHGKNAINEENQILSDPNSSFNTDISSENDEQSQNKNDEHEDDISLKTDITKQRPIITFLKQNEVDFPIKSTEAIDIFSIFESDQKIAKVNQINFAIDKKLFSFDLTNYGFAFEKNRIIDKISCEDAISLNDLTCSTDIHLISSDKNNYKVNEDSLNKEVSSSNYFCNLKCEKVFDILAEKSRVKVFHLPYEEFPKININQNNVKLSFFPRKYCSYNLKIEHGFYGAFVNLPIDRFNQNFKFEKGSILLIDQKKGFIVSEVFLKSSFEESASTNKFDDLLKDENMEFFCLNLNVKNIIAFVNYLRKSTENSSSLSCSSSFQPISVNALIKTFFHDFLAKNKENFIILRLVEYLPKYKTFRFGVSTLIFEMSCIADELKSFFTIKKTEKSSLGKYLCNEFKNIGFSELGFFPSLKFEFDFFIHIGADSVFFSYSQSVSKPAVCQISSKTGLNFSFQRRKLDNNYQKAPDTRGFWVLPLLFNDFEEYFCSENIEIDFDSVILVNGTVYWIHLQNESRILKQKSFDDCHE